ncbi:MAG: lysine 5,6-aminomutase subunit alpha [Deltaproteobacteria bacterium]|nr:lysine 5,6-aminomutase subunit alpha [Deltaproteobacteria bacterium]
MRLSIPPEIPARARELAARIAAGVQSFIDERTTDAVERATLRLWGLDGVDAAGVPLPNVVIDRLRGVLARGASRPVAAALRETGWEIGRLGEAIAAGAYDITARVDAPDDTWRPVADRLTEAALRAIDDAAARRRDLRGETGDPPWPWLYVIVATGNIYEDITQAVMAARQGADIVAVIRSTGQSLLDYVPHGATTEGFGGTYATRENFRLMRAALDEVSREVGRYVRLVNYASGLCMPEIAALGAIERLDMMLNDCMYGILFRDINPHRTFVDQYASRLISARADIVINTGEDNYLTTADAVDAAHTVLASCLLNERFAILAGMPERLMGLGHAFEIDPERPGSLTTEIAHALLLRAVFPEHPLKYMPPTKHMTGDIFRGYQMNAYFNLVGALTGQGIQLLGMLTEAMHTPFLQDRALAIRNAKYAFAATRGLADSLDLRPGGEIATRADTVLGLAIEMLEEIARIGLFEAIARGMFADIKRPESGGKGAAGVFAKSPDYANPLMEQLRPA